MNLVYDEVMEVFSEDGIPLGKVRIHGATRKIALGLLTDAAEGDRVLICDGVAISKVAAPFSKEAKDVSGNSWETH